MAIEPTTKKRLIWAGAGIAVLALSIYGYKAYVKNKDEQVGTGGTTGTKPPANGATISLSKGFLQKLKSLSAEDRALVQAKQSELNAKQAQYNGMPDRVALGGLNQNKQRLKMEIEKLKSTIKTIMASV